MLYLKKQTGTSLLGIWKMEETKENLCAGLLHHEWLEDVFAVRSEKHLLEMLSVRMLLKELLGEEKQICYFPSGRPFLTDKSYHISISHTKGYVAVMLDVDNEVGVDIEQMSEKVRRVQSRLISEQEYVDKTRELEHLLLHWSAKEAVFKVLDTSGIDYLEHLYVHPFTPENEGQFAITENKTELHQQFGIHYMIDKDFVLTYLIKD